MTDRFSRDSSSEIWTHLEALSREGIRQFATTVARDAEFTAPVAGMECMVGTGTAMVRCIYNGAIWLSSVIDSGWLAITPTAGFTGGNSPAVRIKNGAASFRGSMNGAMPANTTTLIGTLPAGTWPPALDGRATVATVDMMTGAIRYLAAYNTGNIYASSTVASTQQIALGALGYLMD